LQFLNPVEYDYKADQNGKHVGFLAEEVPELVAPRDRQSLSPMDIVTVPAKVTQDQQQLAQEQRQIIREQQKRIEKLEKKVAGLYHGHGTKTQKGEK
jgi:hypothetical protein